MTESFLQFVWKHSLFDAENLQTTDRIPVRVLSTGMTNRDAGPDFFNVRLQIGSTVWAGNVEIHVRASDWNRHKHNTDPAYDNVILHVVRYDDQQTLNTKGQDVCRMVLPYDDCLEANYMGLMKSKGWIPCQNFFHRIDLLPLQIWYHGLMVERLQQKTLEIVRRLEQNKNNWNETFYQFLARNFGFKTNSLPFEMLARSVPLNILGKHKDNLMQIEALLYGTAGLLNEELVGDNYFMELKKEFSFLYSKYKPNPVEAHLWKFLRLRPVNFPTIRLAQFAGLMQQSSVLFSQLIELSELSEIRKLFQVQASGYWTSHYRFNKVSHERQKHLGEAAFNNIVINTIVPFLFVYGDYHCRPELKDRALDYLEKVPAEQNSIISNWEKTGAPVRSAFDTQALIQLKNNYCNTKNCLNCTVGTKLIANYL